MRILIIALVFLVSGCSSDIILCPTVKKVRVKESTVRYTKAKKQRHERQAPSASARLYQSRYKDYSFKGHSTEAKSAEHMEEWDCPRPGVKKNTKAVRDNKKRFEKSVKTTRKREPDTVDTLLPQSSRDF